MPVIDYDAQFAYFAEKMKDPWFAYYQSYQMIDGVPHYIGKQPAFNFHGTSETFIGAPTVAPAPLPPHLQITFDTIGQVIPRSIGHCRLALHPIWARGIVESGDEAVSNTQTYAAALCMPIDPLEEGEVFGVWDSGNLVMNEGGVVVPVGWTSGDAALLTTSLAGMVIYPGDEAQLPNSLIVADKGADKTNAFRGMRYIVLPDYPINGGGRGGGDGLPPLSVGFRRTNDGEEPTDAVEFVAGSE